MSKLLSPEAAQSFLRRRFDNQRRSWLEGGGSWPLSVSLGEPTEREASNDPGSVRAWVEAWRGFQGAGTIDWQERRWPRLGPQRLPVRLTLEAPRDVAALIGQETRWQCASARYGAWVATWPALRGAGVLASLFPVLTDYSPPDFERLTALLAWLALHPSSGCYLRQLPIPGMDTKWLDAKRRALVVELLQAIRGDSAERDFYRVCGLSRPAQRLRMRALCPGLRQVVGGLTDIEAPLDELASLVIRPDCVLVVENLETGIALPELPGVVAFMKLGAGISVLGAVPWLRDAPVVYWGDLDTHGFAILDQARRTLPQLRSVLMDEATLLAHRELWVAESSPHPALALHHLTPEEHAVFAGLHVGAWRAPRAGADRVAPGYAGRGNGCPSAPEGERRVTLACGLRRQSRSCAIGCSFQLGEVEQVLWPPGRPLVTYRVVLRQQRDRDASVVRAPSTRPSIIELHTIDSGENIDTVWSDANLKDHTFRCQIFDLQICQRPRARKTREPRARGSGVLRRLGLGCSEVPCRP